MSRSLTDRLRALVFLGCGVGAAAFAVYVLLVPEAYTGSRQPLVVGMLGLTALAAFWGASTLLQSDG
jgi:hypothetical protein